MRANAWELPVVMSAVIFSNASLVLPLECGHFYYKLPDPPDVGLDFQDKPILLLLPQFTSWKLHNDDNNEYLKKIYIYNNKYSCMQRFGGSSTIGYKAKWLDKLNLADRRNRSSGCMMTVSVISLARNESNWQMVITSQILMFRWKCIH